MSVTKCYYYTLINPLPVLPVCCVAVRNCLDCRQRQRDRGSMSSLPISKTQENLQSAASASKVRQTDRQTDRQTHTHHDTHGHIYTPTRNHIRHTTDIHISPSLPFTESFHFFVVLISSRNWVLSDHKLRSKLSSNIYIAMGPNGGNSCADGRICAMSLCLRVPYRICPLTSLPFRIPTACCHCGGCLLSSAVFQREHRAASTVSHDAVALLHSL